MGRRLRDRYYGPEAPKKTFVIMTNLPEKAKPKYVWYALGRCALYVKKLRVEDSTSKKDIASGKKLKVAIIEAKSEDLAKAILRFRTGKIKMGGKRAKLRVSGPPKEPKPSAEEIQAAKEEREKKAAEFAAARKAKHEQLMAFEQRLAKRRRKRRYPMYEGPRYRINKNGRRVEVQRSRMARGPMLKRGRCRVKKGR